MFRAFWLVEAGDPLNEYISKGFICQSQDLIDGKKRLLRELKIAQNKVQSGSEPITFQLSVITEVLFSQSALPKRHREVWLPSRTFVHSIIPGSAVRSLPKLWNKQRPDLNQSTHLSHSKKNHQLCARSQITLLPVTYHPPNNLSPMAPTALLLSFVMG